MSTKNLENWMESVDAKLDNHLVSSAKDISQIKADLSWLKRLFWFTATAVVGLFFK